MILMRLSKKRGPLDELILKMYTDLGLTAVFHKLIEENWKKICVELSSPFIII